MATPSKIGVMISSRCLDSIQLAGKPVHLSELRIKLKQALESEQLLNSPLFEVWINEDAPPAAGLILLSIPNPKLQEIDTGVGIVQCSYADAYAFQQLGSIRDR